jgi:hypothetical protein
MTSIIFHGNCIDGWFSAVVYLLNTPASWGATVNYYPISPNLPWTWPKTESLRGHHVVVTDVMVTEAIMSEWRSVAASFFCVDHHESSRATAVHHADCCVHDTMYSATALMWKTLCPAQPIPDWVEEIDRIDLWRNVTDDDRAIREVLHQIALLPVNHDSYTAFTKAINYIQRRQADPASKAVFVEEGSLMLKAKEDGLKGILTRGSIVEITPERVVQWNLSADWEGKKGFLIDTTGVTLDSTEAAHLALKEHPEADFFVNYRLKTYINRQQITEKTYIYSARSREGFNLTKGSILAGHPCAAGASIMLTGVDDIIPFVIA